MNEPLYLEREAEREARRRHISNDRAHTRNGRNAK